MEFRPKYSEAVQKDTTLPATNRDNRGRLQKGHAGLKKKGSKAKLTQDIKKSLEAVITDEIANLPYYFSQVKSPDRKIDLISKLLPYIVPRAEFDKNESLLEGMRRFTIEIID